MNCPCCGRVAFSSPWSSITWHCVSCDLEWDWTEESGVKGYWSLRDLAMSMESGALPDGVVEIPPGTLPVFGSGEREE